MDSNREQFYFKGFLEKETNNTSSKDDLLNFIKKWNKKDMHSSDIWVNSYEDTYDLGLDEVLKNEFFFDFIIDQTKCGFLEEVTGRDLVLGDLVLRKTFSKKSYMNWHRDTYRYKDQTVGRTPPLIKVIFYPKLCEEEGLQMQISEGSNLRHLRHKYLDRLLALFYKKKKIWASNDKLLVFDSSLLHSAENNITGSFRLIYNFCSPNQLNSFPERKQIINEVYASKLKKEGSFD